MFDIRKFFIKTDYNFKFTLIENIFYDISIYNRVY